MESFGLVTTLRYDSSLLLNQENATFAPRSTPCQLYMLAFHRDRILKAAQAADRDHPQILGEAGLNLIIEKVHAQVGTHNVANEQALKIRIVIYEVGNLELTSSPIPPLPQTALFPESLDDVLLAPPTYRVFVAPHQVSPNFHTRFKTTARGQYDDTRSYLPKAGEGDLLFEILLVNQGGDVMEGSFTTPYFKHSDSWITPAEISGGNIGTTRRWALEKGLCNEGFVSVDSVQAGSVGERVILSNGVRGFGWGRVEQLAV